MSTIALAPLTSRLDADARSLLAASEKIRQALLVCELAAKGWLNRGEGVDDTMKRGLVLMEATRALSREVQAMTEAASAERLKVSD